MLSAAVVKLADTQDLESCGAIRIGSNPIGGIRRAAPFFKNTTLSAVYSASPSKSEL